MLVAVLSVKGSPGVTTFSLALAARWPAPARTTLVEADPSGGDVAAWFSLPSSPGLLSLAAAMRGTSPDPPVLWQHAQTLPGGLQIVPAPPDGDQARAALTALEPTTAAELLRSVSRAPDNVVIVDCGRMDQGSPARSFVRTADAVVLLSRCRAHDLAHLARKLPAVGGWAPRSALLLVGDGCSPHEVERDLGVRPLGRVPHDPRGASVLSGRNPLGRFAGKVAALLETSAVPPRATYVPARRQFHTQQLALGGITT